MQTHYVQNGDLRYRCIIWKNIQFIRSSEGWKVSLLKSHTSLYQIKISQGAIFKQSSNLKTSFTAPFSILFNNCLRIAEKYFKIS